MTPPRPDETRDAAGRVPVSKVLSLPTEPSR
jgi:hypothetical protein